MSGQTNLDYWRAEHQTVGGFGRPYYTLGSGENYYPAQRTDLRAIQPGKPDQRQYFGFEPFGPQDQTGAWFPYMPYQSRWMTGNPWWVPYTQAREKTLETNQGNPQPFASWGLNLGW